MKGALILQWREPAKGREAGALALWPMWRDYFGKLMADGRIDDVEYLFGIPGSDLAIVKGDLDALAALATDADYLTLIAKSQLVLTEFEYRLSVTGEAGEAQVAVFAEAAKEFGYM